MIYGPLIQCPVCGFRGLQESPWTGTSANYDICACCGTEFGLDDDEIFDDPDNAPAIHRRLRDEWVRNGGRWTSTSRPAPPGWNAAEQVAALVAR